MEDNKPQAKQPIPANARLVFKGVLYDVFQWDQRLFDGSTTIFEKVRRVDSAAILPITKARKIIIAKEEQPGSDSFIGALGGRLEPNESALACAKRELLEEAGMVAKRYKLWFSLQPSGLIEWVSSIYIGQEAEITQPTRPDAGEKIELLEVGFEEFLKIAIQPNFRDTQIKLKVYEALLDTEKLKTLKTIFFS